MRNIFYVRMKQLLALPLLLLLMVISTISWGQTVTVSTDQDDYYPGQWVIITGSGWQNDAIVQLALTHLDPLPDPIHAHEAWQVQPNEEGYIYYEWFVEDQELGTSFQLDALGLTTGLNATTYFTDGDKVGSIIVGSQSPNPVVAGNNATFTITVNRAQGSNSSGKFVAYLSITTALPSGVTASFLPEKVSFGSLEDYQTSTLTFTTNASLPTETIYFTVKAANGVSDVSTRNGILMVNSKTPVLTWNNPSDITYGAALSATQLNASSSVPGTYVYSPAAGTVLNAGNGQTLSVTFTPDNQNYNAISKSVLINVAKANQTITWNNPANIVYGTLLSATQLNATIAGVTGGTAPGALTYTPAMGTILNAGSQLLQVDAAATGNYNAASKEVTLIVDKAPSTTVVSVADVNFDGVAHGATASVTGVGNLNLPLTVTYTGVPPTVYAASTTAPTNAGTYLAAASFAGDDNHLSSNDSKTFTIHKAPSTTLVTIAGGPFTYTGSAITPATVAVTGAGGLNLTPTASYASNINAGTATASYAYAGDDNHLASNDSKTFEIGKANSTTVVSIAEGPFTYLGTAITPATVTVSGANLSLTPAASYANNINAGTATASYTYAGDDNHHGSNDSKTFEIGKATATIDVYGYKGIYDGNAHGATGTAVGVAGDPTAAGSTLNLGDSFTNVPGGTAHWTFTGGTNYLDESGDVTIDLSPAVATIQVDGYKGIYDAAPHGATLVSATGVNNANLASSVSVGTETHTNYPGGKVDWSFANNNYLPQSGSVDITIEKADAVVTVNGYSGVYDGAAHGATGAAVGVAGDPTAAGSTLNLGDSFTNVPGGIAHWTFTGGTNYLDESGDVTIDLSPAAATIQVEGYKGIYDAAPHGATLVSATGVNNANLASSVTVGTETYTNYPGGKVDWSFENSNYVTQSGSVDITIEKADAVVTVNGYSGVYDGAAHGATGAAVGVAGDLLAAGSTLNLGDSFTNVPGGPAHWTFTGGNNYLDESGDVTINITPAVATIQVDGYKGIYDAAPHGATLVSATGVNNANLASSVTVGTETYTNYPGGKVDWSFENSNYVTQSGSVDITIEKADAVVTVNGYSGVYDALSHGATGAAVGVAGDPTAAGSTLNLGDSFTNVPGGTAHWTFTGGTNYLDESGDVTINITPAAATIQVDGYKGIYDAAPHGATLVSATGVNNANLASSVTVGTETYTNYPGGKVDWSFANNNYLPQSGSVDITIEKADAVVTVNGYSGVYDGVAHGATGAAVGVAGDPTAAGSTLNLGDSFTNVPGGTVHWTFTGGTNYLDESGDVAIDLSPAVATIQVEGYKGIYDATAHGATLVSATGVNNANLASSVTVGTETYTNYPGGKVDWSFENSNYQPQSGSVDITIEKADAVVTVNGYSGVYDALPHGATGTAVGVAGDLLAAGSTLNLGASFTDFPGGTAHWTFTGGTNYNNKDGDVAIEISQAAATIQVDGYKGIYDAAPHGATLVSATGVNNANLASSVAVGTDTYTDFPGGKVDWSFENSNYLPQSGSVDITIEKADAVVTVNGYSGVYDGAAHGATGSARGVKDELLAGLNLGDSFTNVPGGTANWVFTDVTGNYNNKSGSVQIDITKAASATLITILGAPFTYTGSAIAPASVSVTGAGGLHLTPDPVYANNINAGTASVSYDYPGDINHSGSNDSKTFTIGKATSTTVVSITGGPFTYTGSYITPATVSVTGAGGLSLAPAANYANNLNAGTATANYTYVGDDNHFGSDDSKTFDIGKANAVIAVNPYNVVYDGQSHTSTFTAVGVETPTPADLTSLMTVSGTTHTNAGDYTGDAWSFAGNTNYKAISGTVNNNIQKRPITITADAKSKYCGQLDPALTAKVTLGEVVNGDSPTGNLSLVPTESTTLFKINKGTYTYGTNYAEKYVPADFTIKSSGIDASASSTAVPLYTTSALIKATVTDYSNPDIKVEGAKVTFIVTNSLNSVMLNQDTQTGSGGIASWTINPGSWPVGVYAVRAIVGDGCGESYGYLTIFDANSSFVTGGGWISSPAGAYTNDATLIGKANFGFVSKYKKGSSLVDGNTEFQFNAGDFNFKSSAHDAGTLVISNFKATYRGVGTVNGIGNYGFMVTAIDGAITGSGGEDKFRIKIWDKANGNKVVYDNQIGQLENTEASTKLGGGSIVIHSNDNKNKVAQILPDASAPVSEPTLKAYPNPFTERLSIEFSYATDTKAKLEIYSVTGAKLQTLYDGPVSGGQLYNFEYVPRLVSSQVVFYHLTLDGKTQVGKVLFNERR